MQPDLPWNYYLTLVVTFSVWMTPMRGHLAGFIINYGGHTLAEPAGTWDIVEANAAYRSYDLSRYPDHCGVAAMSPSNLGQTVWVRLEGPTPQPWHECGVIDTIARTDYAQGVYGRQELVEVPRWLLQKMMGRSPRQEVYGGYGEVFFGACPPPADSIPGFYAPPLQIDSYQPVIMYTGQTHGRYPPQQPTVNCFDKLARYN